MESLLRFGLGELTTEQFEGRRCTSCSHLRAPPGGAPPGANCALRALAVPGPDSCCCAAHSGWNVRARPAFGPVFDLSGPRAVRAIPPGDRRSERHELLRVLDGVGARSADALTLRQRVAIAQALTGEDRRCFAPLDRISARFEAAAAPPIPPVLDIFSVLADRELRDDGRELYSENFTWQGRLLILAGTTSGYVLTYFVLFQLASTLDDPAPLSFANEIFFLGTLLGALLVNLGIAIFRWCAIPFRAPPTARPRTRSRRSPGAAA